MEYSRLAYLEYLTYCASSRVFVCRCDFWILNTTRLKVGVGSLADLVLDNVQTKQTKGRSYSG